MDAVVFGLQGAITVDGTAYDGVMPSWFQLSDEEIAAVVTHIVAGWDGVDAPEGFEPYTPADVATSRSGALSPQLVLQRRPSLGDAGDAGAVALPEATYAMAQVERARAVYERLCTECHGDSFTGGLIGGPPLTGATFLQRWGGRSVEALFTYTQSQMPQGGPGSLSPQQYADLVALILSVNGHAAGDVELPGDPEALRDVGVRSP
jgi:mono/diheme cytochrome c family protein